MHRHVGRELVGKRLTDRRAHENTRSFFLVFHIPTKEIAAGGLGMGDGEYPQEASLTLAEVRS